jgi:hypothetical protein
VTAWDHEFAVAFINEGHFRVTDPGPLRAPCRSITEFLSHSLNCCGPVWGDLANF